MAGQPPGYCASAGGATTYERILDVKFVPKDDLPAVTIPIQIANPNGCTYGKACPSYDNSPEYVNAWIDWNGNQQWEAGEQVINNYQRTMTIKHQVRIPANSVDNTWLRANLGHITDAVQSQGDEQAADLCNTLGVHFNMIGEFAVAKPYLARALAINEAVLGQQHPDTALSYNNLGGLLQDMGEPAAAKPYDEQALIIFEQRLGPSHPDTQIVRHNLAARS